MNILNASFTFLAITLVSFTSHANNYVPKPDFVVAKTNTINNRSLSDSELEALVINSQLAGQTEINQGTLKRELKSRYEINPSANLGYLYARVLQKEHKFNAALSILNSVLANQPNHVNALLLSANMMMTQGRFAQAKKQCLQLIGHASLETVTACALDVESQNGNLQGSYDSLIKIKNNGTLSQSTTHLLAEMAFRLNQPRKALQHLQNIQLNTAPVSLIVLWSDAQLALGNYQLVISTLGDLLNNQSNLEDALLLRLAQAEKMNPLDTQTVWQQQMAKRVELRELRQDKFHAADLALYYLTIEIDYQKALQWAETNWQQAKLSSDEKLLMLASQKVKEESS